MTHITIRQTGDLSATPNAEISFDGGAGWPVTVQNPFGAEEEHRLAWYFEQWLKFPFTDGVRAEAAAASVRRYGETLFAQTLRSHDQLYSRYRQAVSQGVETLHFQLIGTPDFHALHWEALWDPDRPRPLILDAAMIRSTVQPVVHRVTVQPSATINLLLVTARPHGGRDVGYRTIQRPLIEMLRASQLPVQVDLVRPGTWRALVDHLAATRRQRGVGHYQIIHFDLHGAVLSRRGLAAVKGVEPHSYKVRLQDRYARPDLSDPPPPTGDAERATAWLFFEDETSDDLDAASAEEVAGLLLDHQIPIAILNACQSGQETGDPETGLGSRLLAAGVQTVVAMGYSVTVSAATRLMATLYAQLFQPPHDLLGALAAGRTALHHEKARRAAYNQLIKLEDWLLPVLYQPSQQTPRQLPLRAMSFDEQIAFYSRLATRYTPPEPEYGFVGRDVDILQIEKRLLATSEGKRRNLLLIQGMGGAGKSTLLRHLAGWWQTTGLVDEVFYFGYDVKAYHLQAVLTTIAHQLLNRHLPTGATATREFAAFQAMQLPLQAKLLAGKLRSERHLLILDNLESVTGDPLAIPNTLPPAEQAALRGFLADLLDGQTLVLLGSRGNVAWLRSLRQAQGTGGRPAVELVETPAPLRDVDNYALPGLDAEAAANLAERILHRQVTDPNQRESYAADPALARLIKLLDGSPLALEVVLSNLARQSPAAILAALEAGDVSIDPISQSPNLSISSPGDSEIERLRDLRTRSILQCIAYAHSNLDAEAQRLLLCLFPFTGVIWTDQLENYSRHLVTLSPPLPLSRLPELLRTAQEWGLLTPHELPGYLRIQPVLPYFLKTQLAQEPVELKEAIETAFRLHYADLAKALFGLFEAKEAQSRETARVLTGVEYENLTTALRLTLAARVRFFDLYAVLGLYLDSVQDHRRGIDLGQSILAQMEQYPPESRFGAAGASFLRVLSDLGQQQAEMKRYSEAEISFQTVSQFMDEIRDVEAQTKASWKAANYHNLGRVAEIQRQWGQAEQHYQQALAIYIEFNDRYSQASTNHQLGMVAQEQRQWGQAEQHYQQALALKIEFNDRYSQALTLHALGSVAFDQDNFQQSGEYYQQAIERYIEFNERYWLGRAYHQLGRVAETQEQ
jgi:tetratricopeptide (TPR) repeat protein